MLIWIRNKILNLKCRNERVWENHVSKDNLVLSSLFIIMVLRHTFRFSSMLILTQDLWFWKCIAVSLIVN